MLSIIIPVRNESDNIQSVFDYFLYNLKNLKYEVLIINDYSEDDTLDKTKKLVEKHKEFKVFDNSIKGLGGAINLGIENASGSNVAIMMADESDDIHDLIEYNRIMENKNLDAVLGTRFSRRSKIIDYPLQKLILNRFFNLFVSFIFWNNYNDYTNAFKIYKTDVLKNIKPLVSESFNIFLEY